MRLFAVLGNPILHSKSPVIHNELFRHFGIDARYIRLHAFEAADAVRLSREIGLEGMNVTSPLKEELFSHVTSADPMARRLRAVNTVLCKERELLGWNTDALGFEGMLRQHGLNLESRHAVVLGAGGAAKAAVVVLTSSGAMVDVVNRTFEKGELIAAEFGCTARTIQELPSVLSRADVFLSCLPRNVNFIDRGWLRPDLMVIDANYGQTELKSKAESAGCKTIDAIDWLIHQAVAAFRLFSGQSADASLIKTIVDRRSSFLEGKTSLGLVGMMGSGKSTIGKALAERLGWRFVDTDQMVEARSGKSIRDLFAGEGESAFRRIEREVIREAARLDRTVIAFGGGCVLAPENRSIISQRCLIIWLWADPTRLAARTAGIGRPLIEGTDVTERLGAILGERRHLYAATADLVVDAGQSVSDVLRDLESEYHQAF